MIHALAQNIRFIACRTLVLGLLLGCCLNAASAADDSAKTTAAPLAPEEAALAFVRQHQSDLAKLLEYMQKKRPEDFAAAIKEIDHIRQRLENLKKRDEKLYELELALWQNDAKLKLLVAELSSKKGKPSDEDRDRIRKLLEEQNEMTVAKLKHEQAQARARLQQLEEQLNKRETNYESILAKGLKQWESRINRNDKKSKSKSASPSDSK